MHTANNSYIEILKQSLTKKIELLDTIMALNVLQKDMLENPDLDPDELEENLIDMVKEQQAKLGHPARSAGQRRRGRQAHWL